MAIRCFIAFELSDPIKDKLVRLQDKFIRELGPSTTAIKWLKPNQLHLTLKFLGDVEDRYITDVCDAASLTAQEFGPFDFEIADCGCFPRHGAARILWAGIRSGFEDLQAFHQRLDSLLAERGFPPENRKFSAHLTLARIKAAQPGHRLRELLQEWPTTYIGIQDVTALTVFQSHLSKAGPTYTPVHHAPLNLKG